jgi:sulfate transport system ATP-binding protein
VEGDRAVVGPLEVEFLDEYHLTSKQARGLVRPHQLDLARERTGPTEFVAIIKHINAAGPQVKIELDADTGDRVRVEMPHERFASMGFHTGESVFVTAREVNLFVDEYNI